MDKNVFRVHLSPGKISQFRGRGKTVKTLQKMIRHPAGRIGLVIGVTLGFIAAVMGEGSKGLLFAGLFRFLAGRFGR